MPDSYLTLAGQTNKPTKCLTPGCTQDEAPAYKRGLCTKCHSSALKLIKAGRATWESLAEMGLAKAQENDDPFMKAFNDKQPQVKEG